MICINERGAPYNPCRKWNNKMRKARRFIHRGTKCTYCGCDLLADPERFMMANFDHFHPRSKGGGGGDNLVPTCITCNTLKGNEVFPDIEAARAYVMEQREQMMSEYHRMLFGLRFIPEKVEHQFDAALLVLQMYGD